MMIRSFIVALCLAMTAAVSADDCELPCCCPIYAQCTPPDPGECPDEGECEDKYGNVVPCPDDDDDDGDECEDKYGNPISCPPNNDCGCCDPFASGYDPAIAAAAGCEIEEEEECDCSDNVATEIIQLVNNSECGPNSPTIIIELPANCSPKIILYCTTTARFTKQYLLVYDPNGVDQKVLGECVYENGINYGEIKASDNRCKYLTSKWTNFDPDNDGSSADEGTKYKVDWTEYICNDLSNDPVNVDCYESSSPTQPSNNKTTSPCE